MNNNIITAVFGALRETKVRPRYRYDQGQILIVKGVPNLPDFFEVHFANEGDSSDATPLIGTPDGVTIPDSYFQSGKTVLAYIYVHDEATDGTTVYKVTIPIINRARPANIDPDPEQADIIAQAIVALNENVGKSEAAAEAAETAQQGAEAARDAADTSAAAAAESAQQSAQSAQSAAQSASAAAGSASSASQSATAAAASAGQSAQSASDTQTYAETASDKALEASQSASAASTAAGIATTKATEAATSASNAASSASAAATSESNAADSATAAGASASTATAKAGEAASSASAAAQSATAAGNAKTAAEAAQQGAEDAAESVESSAAQIRENKQDIANLKSAIDTVSPETKLSWTLKKSINASGVITDSNYTALTDFVRKCGKVTIVRKIPQKDSSGYALSFMVSQFNEDTFISRTNLALPGNSITLEPTCTKYAIAFGRSSGSGVIIQQTDIDNLFDADIYNEADNFKYGLIPTDTTSLASITAPGCYRLELANYANLSDLPDDFPTNRITALINLQVQENRVLQSIVDSVEGHLWIRWIINTATVEIGSWYEIHNSSYLTNVSGANADNIAWNGWYGWGSTESVSNVPSVAGMLLNVIRLAATKYQLAFDYVTGSIYTRNSKNSVWTDWKRLAFASEIPTTGKAINIRHESGSFAAGAATERLHIYVPAETGYILYLMYHFVDTSNYSDVWQIYNAYQVDDNFDYANRKTLTITGEWECAIHLDGRDDFSGGHTHGDEMMQNVVFLKDGVPVTISDFSTLTPCNELRIIRSSTMYDPADHTTAIAEHGVEYTYSKDGVTIDQSLKWLVAESLTNCFLCMFLPSKNQIDRASANSDFDLLTLPSETGTPLTTITKPHSTAVTMWDTSSGMFANVAVPVYPSGLSGGDKMTIHDNDNKGYNKIYYYVCTGGSSSVGELWKSKSIYKIGYKSVS